MAYDPDELEAAVKNWLEALRGDDEHLFCDDAEALAARYLNLCAESVRHIQSSFSRDLQAESLTTWAELRRHIVECSKCKDE